MLKRLGHEVAFATESGRPARGDELMVTGRGLDPWGAVPRLERFVVVGRVLRAASPARLAYFELETSAEYLHPLRWEDIDLEAASGVLLPGGHRARGMRPYLESALLQRLVVDAFRRDLPVAAICHGVLLAARSIDPATGHSVLHGRRTTSLTWRLERTAWRIARVTRYWDPDYYRTYPEQPGEAPGYMSVQQEVTRALAAATDFCDVDPSDRLRANGRHRDTFEDERPAFVVEDGRYVSARWPGDAHTFARRLSEVIQRAAGSVAPGSAGT